VQKVYLNDTNREDLLRTLLLLLLQQTINKHKQQEQQTQYTIIGVNVKMKLKKGRD